MRFAAEIGCALLFSVLPAAVQAYVFVGQGAQPQQLESSGDPIVWPDDKVAVEMTLNFDTSFKDSAVSAIIFNPRPQVNCGPFSSEDAIFVFRSG